MRSKNVYDLMVNLMQVHACLSDQLLCDVLSVWVWHTLDLPSVMFGPCAHKAMAVPVVSCP